VAPEIVARFKQTNRDFVPLGIVFLSSFGETVPSATAYQRELMVDEAQRKKGLTGWLLRKAFSKEKQELKICLKSSKLRKEITYLEDKSFKESVLILWKIMKANQISTSVFFESKRLFG
jgi:hypothetical protein